MKKILSFILLALMVATLAACGNNNDDPPEDVLDCELTPEDPACEEDPTDTRTAEEILADTIIDGFDGGITHLSVLLENMDLSEAMQFEAEFDFEFVDNELETQTINVLMIDNFVFLETGDIVHRSVVINVNEEMVYFDIIFEEVDTGVIIYIDISSVQDRLELEEPEAADIFNLLGVTEDWLMFSFDDSLTNMIEVEVMRELLSNLFFDQMGILFFYEMATDLEEKSGLVLADYDLYLGEMMDNLAEGEYELFKTQLEAVDIDALLLDLDMALLVPEIVIVLTENQTELEADGFDVVSSLVYIQANGTELWLSTLSDADAITFFMLITDDTEDELPIFCEDQMIEGCVWMDDYYHDDPVGDYLRSNVNLYDVITVIRALKDNLLLVDFDALVLETVNVFDLKDAFYEGQTEYDAYLVTLAATAPESALILSSFSEVAAYFEEMVFIPDVRYAIDNLTIFENYLTLDYYINNDLLVTSIDKTDTFEIETTFTIDENAYGTIFESIVADIAGFVDGFNDFEIEYREYINCPDDLPVGEVCEDFDEYPRIVERLNAVSYLDMIALYDPSNPNTVQLDMDFTEMINAIINIEMYDDEKLSNAINNLYVPEVVLYDLYLPTVDIENDATIVWTSSDPAVITNTGIVNRSTGAEEYHIGLQAMVTVGSEVEYRHFNVMVPALGTWDDWYDDNDHNNGFNIGGMDIVSVTNLSLTLTVSEGASVTIPTNVNDVNAIAQEFAKFSLTLMAYDYLDRIYWYYYNNEDAFLADVGQVLPLDHYVDEFYVTLAFDDFESKVTVGGTYANPTISIVLYWNDGTSVFINPLTYAELDLIMGDGTGPPSLTAYNLYIANVDLTTFNMTKLLFVYIFNDTYEDDYEEPYYPEE